MRQVVSSTKHTSTLALDVHVSPHTHLHQNLQWWFSGPMLKSATYLCGPKEMLGTHMFFRAGHLEA